MFNVVELEPALERLAGGDPLPARAVALTFDDGYRDNLELAVPLLRDLNLPATFFLVPGLLSRETDPWWETVSWAVTQATVESIEWEGSRESLDGDAHRFATLTLVTESLKRREATEREAALEELVERLRPAGARPAHGPFLDWSGASELARAGFGIGSHTYSHVIFAEETAAVQRRELAESRRALEQELDVPVSTLAYPNGTSADYGSETIELASGAGYEHALTTRDGWNSSESPPFELRRFVLYPERGLQGLAALSPAARRTYRLLRQAGRSTRRGLRRAAS